MQFFQNADKTNKHRTPVILHHELYRLEQWLWPPTLCESPTVLLGQGKGLGQRCNSEDCVTKGGGKEYFHVVLSVARVTALFGYDIWSLYLQRRWCREPCAALPKAWNIHRWAKVHSKALLFSGLTLIHLVWELLQDSGTVQDSWEKVGKILPIVIYRSPMAIF